MSGDFDQFGGEFGQRLGISTNSGGLRPKFGPLSDLLGEFDQIRGEFGHFLVISTEWGFERRVRPFVGDFDRMGFREAT